MSSGNSGTNVKSIKVMRRTSAREKKTFKLGMSRKAWCHLLSTPFTLLLMHLTISSGHVALAMAKSACNHCCPYQATKCCDSFTTCRLKGPRELKLDSTRTAMPLAITTFINIRRMTRNTTTFRLEHGGRGECVKVATCRAENRKKSFSDD